MLIQDPSQLVFKSKRTKFVIEKFHLPPDLSENVSRDNKDKTLKQTNIDFWCFFFRCKQWPLYKYHSKSDQHTCYSRTSPPRWRRRPGRASWWWQPCPCPLPRVLMTRMKSSSPQTDQQYLMPQLHFLESKLETLNKFVKSLIFSRHFRLKGVDSASNRYRWRWDDNDNDDDRDNDNDYTGGMTQPAQATSRRQRVMAQWPASTTPSCTPRQRWDRPMLMPEKSALIMCISVWFWHFWDVSDHLRVWIYLLEDHWRETSQIYVSTVESLSFHQPLNASGESLINVWLINKWNHFQFDSGTQWSAWGVTGWGADREDCLQSKVHHHRREVRDGHIGNASSSGDPFYRFHDPEDFLKDARIHYFWFINTVNYGQTPTVN